MLAASSDFATRDLHTYTWHRATLAGRNLASRNADLFLARFREDQVFVVCFVLSPGSILATQSRVCAYTLASGNSGSDVRHTWRPCSTSTVARFSMLFPPILRATRHERYFGARTASCIFLSFSPFISLASFFFFSSCSSSHVQRKFSLRILARKCRPFSSGFLNARRIETDVISAGSIFDTGENNISYVDMETIVYPVNVS